MSKEEHVWKEVIKEVDLNGDGQIDFEDFVSMMNKQYAQSMGRTDGLAGMPTYDGNSNWIVSRAQNARKDDPGMPESNLPSTEVSGLGTFQVFPGDAMTKFSHRCSHAVEATSALNKEEVRIEQLMHKIALTTMKVSSYQPIKTMQL